MKFAIFALLAASSAAMAQGFEPIYPCREQGVSSACAKFPYLPPALDTVMTGTKITCELAGDSFSSLASQHQLPQLDCIYGQCTQAGYGLYWYQTYRTLSNQNAPRILLSTQAFETNADRLDAQDVTVSFNAAQAFFDFSDVSDAGTDALNAESDRLANQRFNVSVASLLAGVQKRISVGLLAEDRSVSYVDVDLRCTAQR